MSDNDWTDDERAEWAALALDAECGAEVSACYRAIGLGRRIERRVQGDERAELVEMLERGTTVGEGWEWVRSARALLERLRGEGEQ